MTSTGNVVYIKVYGTPATTLVVGAQSGSGKCFWVRDTTGAPGTQYLQTSSPCSGYDARRHHVDGHQLVVAARRPGSRPVEQLADRGLVGVDPE